MTGPDLRIAAPVKQQGGGVMPAEFYGGNSGDVSISTGRGGYGDSSSGSGGNSGNIYLKVGDAGTPSGTQGSVRVTGSIIPTASSFDLGSSGLRWNYIYANNSVNVSDKRKKKIKERPFGHP